MALARPAGIVDPLDVLCGHFRESFRDFDSRVLPPEIVLDIPLPCLCLPKDQLVLVYNALFESGTAIPFPVEHLAKRPNGSLLTSGLLCVKHTADTDRLIFDRRPRNAGEKRLNWARLPIGSQLSRIVLNPFHSLQGSGDDLQTFFPRLQQHPSALKRNAFGRPFLGSLFP